MPATITGYFLEIRLMNAAGHADVAWSLGCMLFLLHSQSNHLWVYEFFEVCITDPNRLNVVSGIEVNRFILGHGRVDVNR